MKLSRFIALVLITAFASACGTMSALTNRSETTTLVGPIPVGMSDNSQINNRKVHVVGYVQVDLDGIDTTNKTLPSVRQMLLEKAKAKFGDVDAVVSLAFYHESIASSTSTQFVSEDFLGSKDVQASGTSSMGSNVYVEAAAIKYVD